MKKICKKIIRKAIYSALIIAIIAGIAKISNMKEKDITVSNVFSENTPIIVLDAGHAECT